MRSIRSLFTRPTRINVRCSYLAPPKLPKTGGGGNGNGNGNNNGNKGKGKDQGDDENIEIKRNTLERAFVLDADITASDYLIAMKSRWGRAYMSVISEDDNGMATLVMSKRPIPEKQGRLSMSAEELRSVEEIVEIVNAYGLGPVLLMHIKYGTSLSHPGRNIEALHIPLSVPMSNERVWEWAVDEEDEYYYYSDEDDDDDGGNIFANSLSI